MKVKASNVLGGVLIAIGVLVLLFSFAAVVLSGGLVFLAGTKIIWFPVTGAALVVIGRVLINKSPKATPR